MAFNTPSGVAQFTEHNWIGSNAAYNLIQPVIDPKEARVWGTQDITGLIDLLGGKNFIKGISYRHFEEDRIHEVIVATCTTGAVGATITCTVDAGDIMANYPAAAVEPYIATGAQANLLPVRVNEVLLFPNGAQGVVTTVTPSGPTFTVISTNGIVIPTMLVTDTIINLGVSVGEGKDMPTSFNYREGVYYNVTEIMEDSHKTTGTALGDKTWVEFEFKGAMKFQWWFKGQSATFKRFRNFREMKFVAGEKVDALSTAAATYDATLTRTEGLIPFASSYNATNTFSLASGLTIDDYQTIVVDSIDKNMGTTEYSNITSIRNRQAMEAFIRTEMKNGGVQFAAFSGGEKQAVDFGFDSFQTLGYTTHLMTYQPFNNPTLLGATGHKYSNLSVLVPMNKEVYALGETKEKTEVPSMRINYVDNGFSREWEEFITGGTNGIYTNTVDAIQINFRSQGGFEGFGANRWTTIQGV